MLETTPMMCLPPKKRRFSPPIETIESSEVKNSWSGSEYPLLNKTLRKSNDAIDGSPPLNSNCGSASSSPSSQTPGSMLYTLLTRSSPAIPPDSPTSSRSRSSSTADLASSSCPVCDVKCSGEVCSQCWTFFKSIRSIGEAGPCICTSADRPNPGCSRCKYHQCLRAGLLTKQVLNSGSEESMSMKFESTTTNIPVIAQAQTSSRMYTHPSPTSHRSPNGLSPVQNNGGGGGVHSRVVPQKHSPPGPSIPPPRVTSPLVEAICGLESGSQMDMEIYKVLIKLQINPAAIGELTSKLVNCLLEWAGKLNFAIDQSHYISIFTQQWCSVVLLTQLFHHKPQTASDIAFKMNYLQARLKAGAESAKRFHALLYHLTDVQTRLHSLNLSTSEYAILKVLLLINKEKDREPNLQAFSQHLWRTFSAELQAECATIIDRLEHSAINILHLHSKEPCIFINLFLLPSQTIQSWS